MFWRREWDSNPRYSLKYTRFPSVRLKPLGHLSAEQVDCMNLTYSRLWLRATRQFAHDCKRAVDYLLAWDRWRGKAGNAGTMERGEQWSEAASVGAGEPVGHRRCRPAVGAVGSLATSRGIPFSSHRRYRLAQKCPHNAHSHGRSSPCPVQRGRVKGASQEPDESSSTVTASSSAGASSAAGASSVAVSAPASVVPSSDGPRASPYSPASP